MVSGLQSAFSVFSMTACRRWTAMKDNGGLLGWLTYCVNARTRCFHYVVKLWIQTGSNWLLTITWDVMTPPVSSSQVKHRCRVRPIYSLSSWSSSYSETRQKVNITAVIKWYAIHVFVQNHALKFRSSLSMSTSWSYCYVFMDALWNRAGRYIFALWFLSSTSLWPPYVIGGHYIFAL